MQVLYFSRAAELTGCREENWAVNEPLTLAAFWEEAVHRHPSLVAIQATCRVASGGEYVGADGVIDPGEEAAVIPPVSGG